jgi:hypothetical protein
MPRPSYGKVTLARLQHLLMALVQCANGEVEKLPKDLSTEWKDSASRPPALFVETTLQALFYLCQQVSGDSQSFGK